MTEVIGVRFKEVGKVYTFDPVGQQFAKGTPVIVETARGLECGTVIDPKRLTPRYRKNTMPQCVCAKKR